MQRTHPKLSRNAVLVIHLQIHPNQGALNPFNIVALNIKNYIYSKTSYIIKCSTT